MRKKKSKILTESEREIVKLYKKKELQARKTFKKCLQDDLFSTPLPDFLKEQFPDE